MAKPPTIVVLPGEDSEAEQTIPGQPGPRGNPGDTGAQGPAGPAIYLEAEPGDDGLVGPPGTTGPTGPQGNSGVAGIRGPSGLDGDPGEPGLDGIPGPQGPQGIAGPQGTQGGTGPAVYFEFETPEEPYPIPGPQGPAGQVGVSGSTGAPGPAVWAEAEVAEDPVFRPGPQGVAGATGAAGPTGPAVLVPAEDNEAVVDYGNPGGPNPRSSVTTPAVPATGVAIVNTTGVNVTAYVKPNGLGGFTNATIGGVSVGTFTSTATELYAFSVSANQTISLTYTNAPTWVWIGT